MISKKKLTVLFLTLALLPLVMMGLGKRPLPTVSAETTAASCYSVYLPMVSNGSTANAAKATEPDGTIITPPPTGNLCPTGDAFPDFNGDGYADLAVGVPDEDVTQGLTYVDAGAVHVIYGSNLGLEALAANAAVDDQLWHRAVNGLDDIAVSDGDSFGQALGLGDFNNDGYDDLAIGVPGSLVGADDDAGAVQVMYGSADGLTTTDSQTWTQDTVLVEDSAQAGDYYGAALTAADFNGDGYDDLAVGIPYETVGGDAAAGAINIIYGSSNRLRAGELGGNATDDFLTQDVGGFVASPAEANDRFGFVLTSGDFNGDNIDDLAVGTPMEENGAGLPESGAVQIFYGNSDYGLVDDADAVTGAQHIRADSPGVDNAMEANERFGYSLAAADFDGDGYDDLAIGTPHETHGSGESALFMAGVVNIVFGAENGLDTAAGAPIWHQDSTGTQSIAGELELFGFSLAAADFNQDGYADLAVGVPFDGDPVASVLPIGSVHIFYSDETGLTNVGDEQLFDSDNPEEDDGFGVAVTAVDSNGDGYPELAVGAYLDDPVDVADDNVGSVFVFNNDDGSFSMGDSQNWYQGKNGASGAPELGDHMGAILP